jgi:hypothetical protein
MIKCACNEPDCNNYVEIDSSSHMMFMTKGVKSNPAGERENAVYLDPNSIVAIIKQLRETLDDFSGGNK